MEEWSSAVVRYLLSTRYAVRRYSVLRFRVFILAHSCHSWSTYSLTHLLYSPTHPRPILATTVDFSKPLRLLSEHTSHKRIQSHDF